jgi:probable rRNA maturation factor
MILLDPDLDPDPSPKTKCGEALGCVQTLQINKPRFRLPSARTLARFLSRRASRPCVYAARSPSCSPRTRPSASSTASSAAKTKPPTCSRFPPKGLGARGIAGDLAISVTTALKSGREQGHSLSTEIKVLILHGLLHLAGYDHEVDDGKMARRERLLRAKLKLPQGLIERAAAENDRVPPVSLLRPGSRPRAKRP